MSLPPRSRSCCHALQQPCSHLALTQRGAAARCRYSSGCGIQAHADGPLFQPRVAILSLGRPACIRFYKIGPPQHDAAAAFSVVLQPASLFCFGGELYTDYKHAIPELEADVVPSSCMNLAAAGVASGDALDCSGCRYSVTLRSVSHVAVDAEQAELPMCAAPVPQCVFVTFCPCTWRSGSGGARGGYRQSTKRMTRVPGADGRPAVFDL